MLLPVVWTLFALACVGGFLMLAAYWLDLGQRRDLPRRTRLVWLAGLLVFPLAIPAYAFHPVSGWTPFLRAASFVPLLALALFLGFYLGLFT